jgi:pimeloyl-ACP methyl ester carboxylesterase
MSNTHRPWLSFVRVLSTTAFVLVASFAGAAGPTVSFTLPAENAMPAVFGSLPFPSDLYFDQGEPLDGDGTLINNGATFGIQADVVRNANFVAVIERGLDVMDGFGVTTACSFFFSGSIDTGSLPSSPRLTPSPTDSVILMDLTDGSLVPIQLKANVDTRIPNALAVMPVPGNPLKQMRRYACVLNGGGGGVTGGGMAIVPSADFVAARTGASANTDANSIYGSAATFVAANGGPAVADIAGMAVFTTQSTTEALRLVQTSVLPSLANPTADFSDTLLVFNDLTTPGALDALFGPTRHDDLSIVATGYFNSPRFQSPDTTSGAGLAGPTEDFPNLSNFAQPCTPACEPNDERFIYTSAVDKTPVIQVPNVTIPFTVAIPSDAAPVTGYPIVIDQHGLGGDRKTTVDLANVLASEGFASIGIDAVAHGFRFVNPIGTNINATRGVDQINNFGGTAIPDGFSDGIFLALPISSISVQLGFFQAFVNLVGAADNFRQTCADLMQLVRLIQSNSIDGQLGVNLDENNIYYIGHSLGGIMGSCLAAFEPDIQAYALNATGGGLVSQLLLNSSIGAGALSTLNTIFTLDPANVQNQYALFTNMAQGMFDPADPAVEAEAWIKNPIVGGPRNVMQISDDADEVVPNQANEAVGVSAGLEIFDPFLDNLLINPSQLAVAATTGTISGNGPSGVTAFYLQQGNAAHAATVSPFVSRLSFVPGHAIVAEWPNAFPGYQRSVRIKNAFVLPNILDWFNDIVDNGTPGTFDYTTPPNFNPIQSVDVASGPSTTTFFDRTVNAGGAVSYQEPTSDVEVMFTSNSVAARVSANRSVLGTTADANNDDLPPGVAVLSHGILPFFAVVQKAPAGTFAADLSIEYTPADLAAAGLVDGSGDESGLQIAKFGGPGTCLVSAAPCANTAACGVDGPCVELFATTVDTGNNVVTATGLSSFSIFGVVNPALYAPSLSIMGGGSGKIDCGLEFQMAAPTTVTLDKNGNPSPKQSCTDGDPSCDFDAIPGQCTFKLAACINNVDSRLPLCSSLSTVAFTIKAPSEKDTLNPNKPGDAANRAALLAILDDDGPIVLPDGRDNNCAPFDAVVIMKVGSGGPKATTKSLKFQSAFTQADQNAKIKVKKDSDALKLTCIP